MRDEGIEFKTNANVGVNISAGDLKKDYDAVVLAGGSTIPRDLPIPGRELDGVHFAMDFLTQNNRRVEGQDISSEKQLLATDKHVLVIGGGDTGSDCVGTSIRQGAASVTQIELLPKPPEKRPEDTPWPIHPGPRVLAISTSHQEGCDRLWAVSTKVFLGEDGRVTKAKYVDLSWVDVSKFQFEEIKGSEKEFKADLVLLAMGFLNPDPVTLDAFGVDKDNRNNAKTDNQYQTSESGVFAAGDMRRGQSLVVWAIAEGRECAREVDKYLRSGVTRLESKNKTFSKLS
jgi:glutamate synthase (NADPH/NADH) small chain